MTKGQAASVSTVRVAVLACKAAWNIQKNRYEPMDKQQVLLASTTMWGPKDS